MSFMNGSGTGGRKKITAFLKKRETIDSASLGKEVVKRWELMFQLHERKNLGRELQSNKGGVSKGLG